MRTTGTEPTSAWPLNSSLVGLSGTPVTYYSTTPLLISAESGTFGGGIIRIAIHFLELTRRDRCRLGLLALIFPGLRTSFRCATLSAEDTMVRMQAKHCNSGPGLVEDPGRG